MFLLGGWRCRNQYDYVINIFTLRETESSTDGFTKQVR